MSNSNPKVSVIVPVYNAQRHLEKCINSIMRQSIDDIEIILINDGSTDLSPKMCDEFASKDNRIKVLHQANKGISYTRQLGIESSAGEFIQFVDSDDWIEDNMVADLYNYASEMNLDIVGSNFLMDLGDKSKHITCQYATPDEFRKAVLSNEWGVVWKLFIRRTLFKEFEISFPSGINHGEDYIVSVKLLLSSNKIATFNLFGYHYNYVQTDTSLTRNSGIKSTLDQIHATNVVEQYINASPKFKKYSTALIKRKLFCSQKLIEDVSYIIFGNLNLPLTSSLKYSPLKSAGTFAILAFAKLNAYLTNVVKRS